MDVGRSCEGPVTHSIWQSSQFLDMLGEQLAQAREPRVTLDVGAHVVSVRGMYWMYTGLPRVVVWKPNVPSAFRLRCSAIRSKRRRNSPLPWRRHGARADASQRQEERDQLVHLLFGEVHVRIAQQRHQVVGVRSHPRVLKVDDVELTVVQHQVAAVIVAMAEHPRLGGQLLGDRASIPRSAPRASLADSTAPRYASRKVLCEELQLPGQLLDVERDAVRQVVGPTPARAPRCCSVSMSVTAWR